MKIPYTASQLLILIVLSRIYTMLTFTTFEESIVTTIAAVFLCIPVQLLLLFPILKLTNQCDDSHLLDHCLKKSKPLYYFFGIFLTLYFLFIAIYTLSTFEDFLTTTLYPGHDNYSLSLLMLLCVFVSVYYGLSTLCRMSGIMSFFIACISIFIMCFALFDGSMYNVKPVIDQPVALLGRQVLLISLRNFELIPLMYLGVRFKGEFKQMITKYFTVTTLIISFLLFMILYILGDYVKYQVYPLYALTSFVEVSILQRLDSFYAIIWMIIAFIRISFYLLLAKDVVMKIIPKSVAPYTTPCLFLIVIFSTMLKDYYFSTRINTIYYFSLSGLFFFTLFVIPLLILIYSYFKNRGVRHD